MGRIREFNCACLIVSLLLALLLNTSLSFTLPCIIAWSSTVVTPLVYYKNTQPIVRSQTRENTRLHATTACKANRGVFLYSSGQPPSSFSCSAAATVLPAELWSGLHLLFPAAAATVLPAEVWSRLHLLLQGHAATQRSRCGPAAIKRLQPPSETSPALTLWADGLNIPMTPSCCPHRLCAALAASVRPLPP